MVQADMDKDLALLLAERACQRLAVLYSHYVDNSQPENLLALFTDDAVWEHGATRYEGHAQLGEFFRQITSVPGRVSHHIIANQLIDIVDDTSATGTMYLVHYRDVRADGGPLSLDGQPVMAGEYEDRYVKTDAGWRFSSRKIKGNFMR